MAKRSLASIWTRALQRSAKRVTRSSTQVAQRMLKQGQKSTQRTLRISGQAAGKAARQQQQAATGWLHKAGQAALRHVAEQQRPPPGDGDWLPGIAFGPAGARRFHLYRPPEIKPRQRLPLLVMLHGCGQSARDFACSTRMNRLASREGYFVLYPQQEMVAHPQGCWNWYDTRSGRALAEAATLLAAVDQVLLLHPIDRTRVAIAGLSAGASMAALMAARHPGRFRAVAMHSGVPPGCAHSSADAVAAMLGQRAPRLPAAVAVAAGALPPLPPLLIVHGGADTVVSVRNARAAARAWADAVGAAPAAPRVVQRGGRHAMTVTDFKQRGRSVVTLCELGALGHAWSGGDARQRHADARGPDASRMVWAFAKRQFG